MILPEKKRTIAVLGNYGVGNLGDDLLSYFVVSALKQVVDIETIAISAPRNCYLEQWFPGLLCLPEKELLHLRGIYKVIFGGGGQFFAFPPSKATTLFGLRKCTSYRLFQALKQVENRKYLSYGFCVGIGPLHGFGARWITKKVLKRIDDISVRDDISYGFLRKFGLNGRNVSDPIFAERNRFNLQMQKKADSIGIIIRYWNKTSGLQDFIKELIKASIMLKSKGKDIQFFSLQQEYDFPINKIVEDAGFPVVSWNPYTCSLDDFVSAISSYGTVLSMRAHGLILGTLGGSVCCPIILEPKLSIIANKCGWDKRSIPFNASAQQIQNIVCQDTPNNADWKRISEEADAVLLEREKLQTWVKRTLKDDARERSKKS